MPHSAQHETEPIPQTWDIQARGVAKLYGDFPAVQNIDLDVPQGQFLGLLGLVLLGGLVYHYTR